MIRCAAKWNPARVLKWVGGSALRRLGYQAMPLRLLGFSYYSYLRRVLDLYEIDQISSP